MNNWTGGGRFGAGLYLFKGMTAPPSYTDNGNGTITIAAETCSLYNNVEYLGIPRLYEVAGGTFTPTDNAISYLAVNHNAGVPIFQIVSDVSLFATGTYVPVFTIFRNGIYLHITNWDSLANGLPEKIFFAAARTLRYLREYGLELSEAGTRSVVIAAGKVYIALSVPITLAAVTSAADNAFFWKHVAGVWTQSVITTYNNTEYDNGTNSVTLTNNRYAINWIYRGVEDQKHIYIVLGQGDYLLPAAVAAQPPASLPAAISSHAMLVGRIIVEKSAATATRIDSAFAVAFAPTAISGFEPVIANLPTYADNAAAKAGGLVANQKYRTSTGIMMIVYD